VDLNGKVVLITGASRGIGAACARAFALRGARLLLAGRSAEALARVCEATRPAEAAPLTADLRRPEEVASLAERALARYGRIDVLVNNAGIGLYQPSWQTDPSLLREMMEVNFFAPAELIRRIAPSMRRHGGVIVNVSSVAGKVSLPWLTLYSSSKAALNFLSDGLRLELREAGVRVVAVCPGYVSTGFPEHVLGGRIPRAVLNRKRFTITAEQCASAIVASVEKEKRTVVTPAAGWLLVGAAWLFPAVVDRVLARMRGPETD
jgi:short-subunit dehydrogenase